MRSGQAAKFVEKQGRPDSHDYPAGSNDGTVSTSIRTTHLRTNHRPFLYRCRNAVVPNCLVCVRRDLR